MSKKSKRSLRVFSDEFKQDAVDLVVKQGYSFRAVAEAIIGSCAWLVVLAIRLQAWWFLALVVFVFGLLTVRPFNVFLAGRVMPQLQFLCHMQTLCRDLGAVQFVLIVLLWATGGLAQTQGTIEGYPVWSVLAFIAVLCTAMYFLMGYAAENARRREQN